MNEQLHLFPAGLTRSQLQRLSDYVERAEGVSPTDFLEQAAAHLERVRNAYTQNRMINVRLATAICDTLTQIAARWDTFSAPARSWLAGAAVYFASCNDDEPDFSSPIGFEDDAEILNACLRFASLNDLCLRVEDYDSV